MSTVVEVYKKLHSELLDELEGHPLDIAEITLEAIMEKALELEAERDRLQRQCEWLRRHWVGDTCPPPSYSDKCREISCDECGKAYLETEPWKEQPDA